MRAREISPSFISLLAASARPSKVQIARAAIGHGVLAPASRIRGIPLLQHQLRGGHVSEEESCDGWGSVINLEADRR